MSKRLEFRVKRINMLIISILELEKRNRWRRGNNYINKRENFLQLKRDFSLKFERVYDFYLKFMGKKNFYYL